MRQHTSAFVTVLQLLQTCDEPTSPVELEIWTAKQPKDASTAVLHAPNLCRSRRDIWYLLSAQFTHDCLCLVYTCGPSPPVLISSSWMR